MALTANATPADRTACLDSGMDGCLSRPLRIEDLAKAVRDLAVPRLD